MDHIPVLLCELLKHTTEMKKKQTLLDLTFGRGGHSFALLKKFPSLRVKALDRDEDAFTQFKKQKKAIREKIDFKKGSFHDLQDEKSSLSLWAVGGFDIILLDLGASTPQLKKTSRGFSFYEEGPLDMRMDQSQALKAEEIVNSFSSSELEDLFHKQSGLKNSKKVIHALIRERKKTKIKSTKELASLIIKALSWKKKGSHPAAPYFLALRMAVNNELEGLKNALPRILSLLADGGRVFIISFHSLEGLIVKNILKNSCLNNEGFLVNKKVIRPLRGEVLMNKASRSAQMRIFQRGGRPRV